MVQIPRDVPNEHAATRQHPRPVVQPGLESPVSLAGFDPPVPDLDPFLHRDHPGDFEHKTGGGQSLLEDPPGLLIETRRILDQGDLHVLVIPERDELARLGPGKAAPDNHGYGSLADSYPQP